MTKHLTRRAAFVVTLVLATALLAACGQDDEVLQQVADLEAQVRQSQTALQAAQAALEETRAAQEETAEQLLALSEQMGETPKLTVVPSIFEFPDGRLRGVGNVWFYGSGLEPGEWYNITVHQGGRGGELPYLGGIGPTDILRQANEEGGFAIPLTRIDARPGRFGLFADEVLQAGGVFVLKLWSQDTGDFLASTPWLVCGQDRANEWCPAAKDTAIAPVVE